MIDAAMLTADLKRLVLRVEDDLRVRVDGVDAEARQEGVEAAWRGEYESARQVGRTGQTWTAWRDDRVTQAAVAWVLTTVFVRFCEDNALVKPVWLAGPGARRQEALDARTAYFHANPLHTGYEWLLQAVEYLRGVPATRDLVDEHSALWTVAPSPRMCDESIAFWQAEDETGALRRDFTDSELSTRFLGDLYQDLSDHAKSTYALLQTPEFVEEFILDRTMEPALRERPLEGFKVIDPTCGSGHFLLGAFTRLVEKWRVAEPGTNELELIRRALESLNGVDVNPFAVAIARFRLIVAALKESGERSLENAPAWEVNVAAGDSLLDWSNFLTDERGAFSFSTEDAKTLSRILRPGSYDVVVGNPPYITVKDKALNARYRTLYTTCKGTYALTAPFMERFFALAKRGTGEHLAGWVGQITSNSFMKREFGTKLVEEYLPRKDLRLVVDSSGAYIPGHGTPTVIIVGRNQGPVGDSLRTVLGVRGEPGRPAVPSEGLVWQSIAQHVDDPGHEDAYTSITDLPRSALATHPWSLAGGGAGQLVSALASGTSLAERVSLIGRTAHTGSDDAYFAPCERWRYDGIDREASVRPLVTGDALRDWGAGVREETLFPYGRDLDASLADAAVGRQLWRNRATLRARRELGGTHEEIGLTWYEFSRWHPERYSVPLGIAFAEVATHNHFVLDRGGKVFKQTAPVIKLPEGASEDDHLALLGLLNSSTACFWLRQKCHDKGNRGEGGGITSTPWERFHQYNGTTLRDFPIPQEAPLSHSRVLDSMAQTLPSHLQRAVPESGQPHAPLIAQMGQEEHETRRRMIALQEELDWEVYSLYGLLNEDLSLPDEEVLPEVTLGERAFEIALARKVTAGQESSAWFERHGSTPVTEIPSHWPLAYRDLVQRRLDLIESDRFINLLERPEYKRRWAVEPWEKRVEKAVRTWLLDRLEDKRFWFDAAGRPRPLSVGQLADEVARDEDLRATLELWAGQEDANLTKSLEKLLADEVVPYLAAYRLKESGLRKRREWERTWELQRREDREGVTLDIPVPPKYATADFVKSSYWSHRGKLDVPKERFISYPGGNRETDPTTLVGWAGWDHAQQSLALATIINARMSEGLGDAKITPLVAGMAELQPWVEQWHNEPDEFGINIAEFTATTLDDHLRRLQTTAGDLLDWRPPAPTRGRRTKKATS